MFTFLFFFLTQQPVATNETPESSYLLEIPETPTNMSEMSLSDIKKMSTMKVGELLTREVGFRPQIIQHFIGKQRIFTDRRLAVDYE